MGNPKAKTGDYKVLYRDDYTTLTGLVAHASEEDHGIGQVLCRLYRLPQAFYFDHIDRDLPGGVIERTTNQHVFAWLSPHDIWELKSDADYYTDGPTAAQMRESSGARYDLQAAAMLRALETA